ncbi:MAG: hypothetical protein JWO03_1941 [Bacteroidetes bacterium]|nr:hypothetical protein [Bacteroidota bacterium]
MLDTTIFKRGFTAPFLVSFSSVSLFLRGMNVCRKICVICAILWSFAANAVNTDTRSDSIDITHTDLHIDVSAFNAKVLYGHADISFKARVNNVNYIRLDLLQLTVDSVKAGGNILAYGYNDSLVSVTLPASLSINQQQTVSVFYHGTPIQPPGDFGGFYWDNTYAFNIGVSFLANPHNFGKVWFPCFDNFVERCTFHFAITTDSTRSAFCNGYADSNAVNTNGTRVWYWSMPDEIPSYLASMSVADYAAVHDSYSGLNGTLPILLVARPSDTTSLKASFVHLKNALSIFESRFGPYEFNRVGYCVVPFTAGAMEHATNISYMRALVNGNTQYESTMAHELSHHWFGDLATCDNEGDMWLNEGWASYCENIFYEGMYGEGKYKQEVRINHEKVIHLAHVDDSAYWAPSPMPGSLTYSAGSVYEKGADRVHTLRGYMGDSLFFHCITSYLQYYKLKDVNSYKMRDYLRTCSGLNNIDDFFADWIFDGGFPDFSIEDKKITNNGGTYSVGISIRQRSDHTSHLFNNVPLQIAYFDSAGNKTVMTTSVSGSCTQYFASLPFYPAYVALDFDEKLSDAVTDQWMKIAGVNRTFDFGVAKMTVDLSQSLDSSLLRIEHHWVAPDVSKNNIPGLHLSDYRYWNVDGIFADGFAASATISYNGTMNPTGYLDNTFITNSEDSLVMMYRPDAQSMWQIENNVVFNRGNLQDKQGTVMINDLQKGQYALAIYDAGRVDSPQAASGCYPLLVADIAPSIKEFRAYPNPVQSGKLTIEIADKEAYVKCTMVNMIGEMVMERAIRAGQEKFDIYMNGLARGPYVISLIDKDGRRISKTIQKVN